MSRKHTTADDEDEAVVFNADAYSVVSSWISKSAITEEDNVAPKVSKPLYTKAKGAATAFATDEDKFLASKILKKKRQEVTASAANDNDDDDDETSFRHKGQSSQHGAKKQKTLSVQEKLLQSLREQQERRKLKNKKKNKK